MAAPVREDAVSGALLAALGAYAAYQGYGFGLGTLSQPGAGFFPFWGAILLLGCGTAIAARPLLRWRAVARAYPSLGSAKVWICVVALVLYAVLVPLIGFGLSTFLVLLGLSRLDAKTTWPSALGIASFGAVGFWLVFSRALGVAFPPSLVGF